MMARYKLQVLIRSGVVGIGPILGLDVWRVAQSDELRTFAFFRCEENENKDGHEDVAFVRRGTKRKDMMRN